MCKYKDQAGQSILEFAIVFPFFMFMFFGFTYTALLCHDYLTLTSIARDSARAAAVGVAEDTIRNRYASQNFLTSVYTWNPSSQTDDFVFETQDEVVNNTAAGRRVTVTLTARCTWAGISLMGMDFSLPPTIQSSLTMHKE
ncbi:TadE/TadG family type IV pilus assembly protein [Anaerosinus massiliensis]|uniref:TadE/TadG family type IV pilus assembly protein n=1 Tax=Massilibacillus massiliensis TaxID=1806837 RepID=UPI000B13611C|nr:TadE/TadG family type IV pilus assembly protein [Massilibacillus massiliensis]